MLKGSKGSRCHYSVEASRREAAPVLGKSVTKGTTDPAMCEAHRCQDSWRSHGRGTGQTKGIWPEGFFSATACLQALQLPGGGQQRTLLWGEANPGSRIWKTEQEIQQQMVKPDLCQRGGEADTQGCGGGMAIQASASLCWPPTCTSPASSRDHLGLLFLSLPRRPSCLSTFPSAILRFSFPGAVESVSAGLAAFELGVMHSPYPCRIVSLKTKPGQPLTGLLVGLCEGVNLGACIRPAVSIRKSPKEILPRPSSVA